MVTVIKFWCRDITGRMLIILVYCHCLSPEMVNILWRYRPLLVVDELFVHKLHTSFFHFKVCLLRHLIELCPVFDCALQFPFIILTMFQMLVGLNTIQTLLSQLDYTLSILIFYSLKGFDVVVFGRLLININASVFFLKSYWASPKPNLPLI